MLECPGCGYQLTDKELCIYTMPQPLTLHIVNMTTGERKVEQIQALDSKDDINIDALIKKEIMCRSCCQMYVFGEVTAKGI